MLSFLTFGVVASFSTLAVVGVLDLVKPVADEVLLLWRRPGILTLRVPSDFAGVSVVDLSGDINVDGISERAGLDEDDESCEA